MDDPVAGYDKDRMSGLPGTAQPPKYMTAFPSRESQSSMDSWESCHLWTVLRWMLSGFRGDVTHHITHGKTQR